MGVVGELGLGLGSHCTEKAEKKCVLNPHYNSFERDSTPYGQNVGVSEVHVFD